MAKDFQTFFPKSSAGKTVDAEVDAAVENHKHVTEVGQTEPRRGNRIPSSLSTEGNSETRNSAFVLVVSVNF